MRKILQRGIIVCVTVLMSSCCGAKAAAQAASLEVNPATVENRQVAREVPIDVRVRLKAGDQDLSDITLSSFSNDGIAVIVDDENAPPGSGAHLPSGAEKVWKLRLVPGKGDVLPAGSISVNVMAAFKEGK